MLAASKRKPPRPPPPPPPLPPLLLSSLPLVAVALCTAPGTGLESSTRLLVLCSGSKAASESHTAAAPRPAAATRSSVSTQHGMAPSRRLLLERTSSGASFMIDSRSDLPSAARALITALKPARTSARKYRWGDIAPPWPAMPLYL